MMAIPPSLTTGLFWNCMTVFAIDWLAAKTGFITENLE